MFHFAPKKCHFAPACHVPFRLRDYVWIKRITSTIYTAIVSIKIVWKYDKEVNDYIQQHSVVMWHYHSNWRPVIQCSILPPKCHFAPTYCFPFNPRNYIWSHFCPHVQICTDFPQYFECSQDEHRENMSSAKLPHFSLNSRGTCPNFHLTPFWLGYSQLGSYLYHQPSLWWRLWSTASN